MSRTKKNEGFAQFPKQEYNSKSRVAKGLKSGVVELSNNGFIYHYNFKVLTTHQVEVAKNIFNLKSEQADIIQKNPLGITDKYLESSGHNDLFLKGLSYLLSKRKEDGSLERWLVDESTNENALLFLKGLPAEDYVALEAIKQDFFSRLGIVDKELARQLAPFIAEIVNRGNTEQTESQTTTTTLQE